MKSKIAMLAALAGISLGLVHAEQPVITDDSLGLSPVSVYDTPAPAVFEHRPMEPKQSGTLPRYWEGAPPQTPHRIDKFLPITAKINKCLDCHEDTDNIGKKIKGQPTPMPESHYVKTNGELADSDRRYVCTLCHAPQAEVGTLVDNTFQGDK